MLRNQLLGLPTKHVLNKKPVPTDKNPLLSPLNLNLERNMRAERRESNTVPQYSNLQRNTCV